MTIPLAARRGPCLPVSTLLILASLPGWAEDAPIQVQLDELRRQNDQLGLRLAALERQPAGAGQLRLIDLSLDILMAAGTSTADAATIRELQGGGHDPSRRGFTFQGAELSFAGAVDPFFTAEAHLVAIRDEPSGETGIELEEAFARSTCLPAGLELKAGQYLTEFGRFNPTHPHAWQFIDQPVIVGRVFGGDGQRSPGARLLCSLPTTWLSELTVGLQDANGETSPSFLSNDEAGAIGGRPYVERDTRSLAGLLANLRWANAWDVGDESIAKCGFSAVSGPNAAGEDTRTVLWGVDAAWRWRPTGGAHGWPFLLVEAEWIDRAYEADAAAGLPADTLRDRGGVLQAVYGFLPAWAGGLRGEWCSGSGDSLIDDAPADRADDPQRDDRLRLAALISWQPSEFTHFRLQYNFDRADHLDQPEHSIWLGAEFLIGAHPAHTF
jgi:hypothetical protein